MGIGVTSPRRACEAESDVGPWTHGRAEHRRDALFDAWWRRASRSRLERSPACGGGGGGVVVVLIPGIIMMMISDEDGLDFGEGREDEEEEAKVHLRAS